MKQINYLSYFSGDHRILTVDSDANSDRLSLWDAYTGQQLKRFHMDGEGCIGLACSPNSEHILCGDIAGILFVWRFEGRRVSSHRIDLDEDDEVFAVGFSPNSQLAFVGVNNSIQIWKVSEWQKIGTISAKYESTALFAPDNQSIIIGGSGELQRTDLITGKIIQSVKLAGEPVTKLVISSDGALCYAWDPFGIFVWELSKNQVHSWNKRDNNNFYTAGDLSFDGKLLVSVLGKQVYTFDVETKRIVQEYVGHLDKSSM